MNAGIVSAGDSGAYRWLVLSPSQVRCPPAGPHQQAEDPNGAQTVYQWGGASGQSGPLYPTRGKARAVYSLEAICHILMQ